MFSCLRHKRSTSCAHEVNPVKVTRSSDKTNVCDSLRSTLNQNVVSFD